MATIETKFVIKETNNKLLEPCWIAGERKFSTKHKANSLAHHEIGVVNVVDCCKRIHDIIDYQQQDERNNRFLAFRDIVRLTFGVSYIHRQQVSALLDSTRALLNQIKGTHLEEVYINRKRKRVMSNQVTTTTTTVCVAKRRRVMSPQLLDEAHLDYYREMLTESQLWATNNEIRNIKEHAQTICTTTDHFISITEEVMTLRELDSNLLWNDGFGEPNQMDKSALEEFLTIGNTLKRKSPIPIPSLDVCYKKPKLSSNESLTPCTATVNSPETGASQENVSAAELADQLQALPQVHIVKSKKCKKRKSIMKIDKCIKLSHEALRKNQKKYRKGLANALDVTQQIAPQREVSLSSFKQSHLFSDHLSGRTISSRGEMDLDCEYTLRTILDIDFSDVLAKSILSNIVIISQQMNCLEEIGEPIMPIARSPESHIPIDLELQTMDKKIKHDITKHVECSGNKNIDSYSVLMALLNIWCMGPDIKSINANQFVKSYPNRFTAALAFSHLLGLQHEGFIELSTKLESLEIDQITLGPKSNKLLEKIFQN